MICIYLFLYEFVVRGFFFYWYDVIDFSLVLYEKLWIYDVDCEMYLFSLFYIYFVWYNYYIFIMCKYGMEGLNKLVFLYIVYVYVVLWVIVDLMILIYVLGFKFVLEIFICRLIKIFVFLY